MYVDTTLTKACNQHYYIYISYITQYLIIIIMTDPIIRADNNFIMLIIIIKLTSITSVVSIETRCCADTVSDAYSTRTIVLSFDEDNSVRSSEREKSG